MSESIQITPAAGAGPSQSKLSSLESVNNPDSGDDSAGFTAVFASYTDSESDTTEQKVDEDLTELLSELLPREMGEDGNALPEQDKAVLWQAMFALQSSENSVPLAAATQTQAISLLDGQRKPAVNPALLSQDYFNTLALQSKEPASLSSGLALNNLNMQLAAAQINPQSSEAVLFNMNDSLAPVHATSSTLSQGLAAVGLGTATQSAVTQTQLVPLNMGHNAWESNLGSRLQMLVGQNVQTAEIRLDPPELGALDIKIKISNEVANVNITSPHAQVREALESAIPKLREMFEQSGLSLGDVNVGQESFAHQQDSSEQEVTTSSSISDSEVGDEPITVTRKIISDNLLDIYA